MELAFGTRSLRSLCADEEIAVQQLGRHLATELLARIADLRAASTFDDIVAGRPEFLNDRDPRVIIVVTEGVTMVIRPNQPEKSRKPLAIFDWAQVYRIRIDELTTSEAAEGQ